MPPQQNNVQQMMSTKTLAELSDPGSGGSPNMTPSLIDSMNSNSPNMLSKQISFNQNINVDFKSDQPTNHTIYYPISVQQRYIQIL